MQLPSLPLRPTLSLLALLLWSCGPIADDSRVGSSEAGPAEHLVFEVQPSDAQVNTAIAPAIRVRAVDANGNTATDFSGVISIGIANNAGNGFLSGTTDVSAVEGVATFGNLGITSVGNGYTLYALSGSLTQAVSDFFDISF